MFETRSDHSKLRGYRIKIYPNENQRKKIDRFIELSRWVYNWAVELQTNHINETGHFYRYMDMYPIFTKLYNDPEYSMLKEMPKHIGLLTLRHVETAFKNFFAKRTRYPKFKSAKYSKKSIEVRNEPNAFYFKGTKVKIEVMVYGDGAFKDPVGKI